MRGLLVSLLDDYICDQFGLDIWEDAIEKTLPENDKIYFSVSDFNHSQFLAIIDYLAKYLDQSSESLLRQFGEIFFKEIINRIPHISNFYSTPDEVMLGYTGAITNEVNKMYKNACLPRLEIIYENEAMVIKYISDFGLCYFFEGVLLGIGKYYNYQTELVTIKCVHHGDDACIYKLKYIPNI